jgi:hypothetical protein
MAAHKRSLRYTWDSQPSWMADKLEYSERTVWCSGTRALPGPKYAELGHPAYRSAQSGGVDWGVQAHVLFNTISGEVRHIPPRCEDGRMTKHLLVYVPHAHEDAPPPRFFAAIKEIRLVKEDAPSLQWPQVVVIELPRSPSFANVAKHLEVLSVLLKFRIDKAMLKRALKTTVVVLDKI